MALAPLMRSGTKKVSTHIYRYGATMTTRFTPARAAAAAFFLPLILLLSGCGSGTTDTTAAPTETTAAASADTALADGTELSVTGEIVSVSAESGPCTVVMKVDGVDESIEFPDCASPSAGVGQKAKLEIYADGMTGFELMSEMP